jgi:hypothetical protein
MEGKTSLHALTATHDASARGAALGSPNLQAMFGIDAAVPAESDYAEKDQANQRNIYLAAPNWAGFRVPGKPSKLVVVEPTTVSTGVDPGDHRARGATRRRAPRQGRLGALRQRVPRLLDGQDVRDEEDGLRTADDNLKAKDGTELKGFDNQVQQLIFVSLYNSPTYGYVAKAWASDPEFRGEVLSMTRAEGHDTINSVRLDDLYLTFLSLESDEPAFMAAAAKLTDDEKAAIASGGMRQRWLEMINDVPNAERADRARRALGL